MLSFIISNAILVSQALTGMTPATLESREYSDYSNQTNAQQLVVTAQSSQDASRDDITINYTPVTQTAFTRSQIVTQSLPASSSALVSSASKYIGMYLDCTAVVEQALRDLGYGIGDVGPTGFGSVGAVFTDPSQVQAGDIMMRGGHVAIYAGDGMTIQGGFGWGGVVYVDDSPNNYYSFVRL